MVFSFMGSTAGRVPSDPFPPISIFTLHYLQKMPQMGDTIFSFSPLPEGLDS